MAEEIGTHRPRSGLWFPFTIDIVRSGEWRKLSKRAKAIYPVICAFADFKTGECYPSLQTIHRLSGIGRGWVSLAITELVKAGLIRRRSGHEGDSNHYKIVLWGCSITEQGVLHNGAGGSSVSERGGAPERSINNIQITNTQITTTTEPSGHRRSGLSSKGSHSLETMGRELGLKETGLDELRTLMDRFSPEGVAEALKEAVAQGKPTLKYMTGILKNWDREGKILRTTRSELREERRVQERVEGRRAIAENELLRRHRAEAMDLAKARLAEIPPGELAEWQHSEQAQASKAGLTGNLANSYVESRILVRVAEQFGIKGL